MKASTTEKRVELGEYQVNYASEGSGPSMVMLHGGDKREDWSAWRPLMSLASHYSLTIPDLIGFGKSSRPVETPDHVAQARVVHELMERLAIGKGILVGTSWGGQVALELAIEWPETVEALVLISGTYDKAQIPRLGSVNRPTLIIWAEDDLVTQLKAGYLLRDAIRTARLEVLPPVAKNPRYDFTVAHKLETYRSDVILSIISDFLSAPWQKIAEPPEMEPELRGMAMQQGKSEEDKEK
ncbi:MAG: alpha/beta hydrolase [Thaumarchaeota archaeon]|nr:alpha/beta hydrolase [Nitrososphaerota archaeon]